MITKKTPRTKAQLKTVAGFSAEMYDIICDLAVMVAFYCYCFGALFFAGWCYYWILKIILLAIGVGI